MKKIGGIKMNTATRLIGEDIKNIRVYESIKQSLREVKLHKEGKVHLDTWNEYLAKKEQETEE